MSVEAAFCSSCGTALHSDARRAVGASDHEERRVVTVLFADLAGSTALGESLDPEDVRAVQTELFQLIDREVVRHGGITEKFMGDAVVAVFGAPLAHEDDAERALRTALAIREAFPALSGRIADRHGAEVGLRIGVNTGEVVAGREAIARGELMVSGDAVNVAARLQQLTSPGTVLAGERTRLATRRAVVYGALHELDVKGKEAPVRAWEALRMRESRPIRHRTYAAPLVGREDELALLRLTAARVERERAPQLLTVFGHAGVGKSRLVEEFTDALEDARIVTGSCVPYGDGITYLPLAEVASQLTGILDDDPADVALAKLRRTAEESVPPDQADEVAATLAWTLGLALPEGTAGIAASGDARQALHDGWVSLLAALGREALLVLVVDDVHWASEPLLDLIDEIVQRLENTSVLLLCPTRPELLDIRPVWGAGGLSSSSITIGPLDPARAEVLLHELLHTATVPQHVASAILQPAEGNPFFVEEMLSMLVEQGALEKRNGDWALTPRLASLKMPDSIHGVIAARIDLLHAAEREALRRCSVMGRSFWPSAVGVDEEVIASLTRRALVTERPDSSFSGRREFAFKHALTHEVAYATFPRSERRDLHRRVAEWIAERVPDRRAETTELIAYHYEQALLYGDRDAELERLLFEALRSAGLAAVLRGAYATAEGLLARALHIAPSELEHARTLVIAARVGIASRRYDPAVSQLDQAIEVAARSGDVNLQADGLGWKARVCWLQGSWREALVSAQAAVGALEGLPVSRELARALARLSQIEMLRSLPSAEATSLRAIEVARSTGELAAEANARTNLLTERARTTPPAEQEVSEIIALSLSAGAHDEAARAVINYLWSACRFHPLAAVERAVAEAVRELGVGLATEGYAQYLDLSLAALVYVPAGRWDEADAVLAAATEVKSGASNRLVWLWLVTGLALRRGDLERTDRYLPEFVEVALASEEPQRIWPMMSVAIPRALLDADTETMGRLADTVLVYRTQVVTAMAALSISRSLAAAGERDRLAELSAALKDDAGDVPAVTTGRGLLALLDGRADEASRLLLAAEHELRSLGRHYDAACVALDAVRALEASGDTGGTEAVRRRAALLLDELGCVNPW
jgi:predicted ATPase/class 3 adenylate cyclase